MTHKTLSRAGMVALLTLIYTHSLLAANLSGSIKFDGVAPSLPTIKMDADPSCMKKHGSAAPKAEVLLLGPGNAMGNVYVGIKSGLAAKTYPVPKEAVIVDQSGCLYNPHVVVVMKGQALKFKNSDGVLHNVHALPAVNGSFNFAMPGSQVMSPEKNFAKAEDFFKVKCDVHPWMGAWLRVVDHPFYAVTKADGKFVINNLPAGTYVVEAWHEKLGVQTATVIVGANDNKALNFVFKK